MNSKAKLIINLIRLENNPFDSFIFLKQLYKIEQNANKLIIDIPNYIFKEKEKEIIEFILQSKKIDKKDEYQQYIYRFSIYNGINKAYLFLMKYSHMLYELCFKENHKVLYDNIILDDTDFFDIDSRRRMVIINAPYLMKIEGSYKFIHEYISTNLRKEKDNSYQISVFDISTSYCAAKIIKKVEDCSFISKLKNSKYLLEDFHNKLNELCKNSDNNINHYKELISNYEIDIIQINFAQKTSKLKEEFKNNEDYYLMYLYYLWYILFLCYIKNKDFPIEINYMIKYLNIFYNKYLEDADLLYYQKVLLFYSNSTYFVYLQDIKIYEEKKLNYVKKKDIKPNSVYGLSYHFIKEIINKINSKSLLFYPLLLLNNGIYYYNEEPIYGFDMISIDTLKNHLNDLIPEIFFEIEEDINTLNFDNGFNFKGLSVIFLNKKSLLKNYEKDPKEFEYNNIIEEKKNKSLGLKVAKTLIHESFAHNKYLYDSPTNIDSPLRFFCNRNNLVTIVPPSTKIYDEAFILKGTTPDKGESGKFLEFFFGQFRNRLVLDLLLEIDDVSKLYDSTDYFVKDDLTEIKTYIIIKYLLKEKGITYIEEDNTTLEQENRILEEYDEKNNVGFKNLKIDIFKEKKNADNSSEILFYFRKNRETKGYDYYMRKAMEEKDPKKKADFLFELLIKSKS